MTFNIVQLNAFLKLSFQRKTFSRNKVLLECSSETCINSSDCRLAEELLFHGQSVATPRSDWAVSQLRRTRAFVDLCARLPGMPIGDVDIDDHIDYTILLISISAPIIKSMCWAVIYFGLEFSISWLQYSNVPPPPSWPSVLLYILLFC